MSDKYQEIVGTNKNKIVRMNKHIALSLSHIGSQLLQLLVFFNLRVFIKE